MESAEIFGFVAPCPRRSSSGSQQACTFHVCHEGISLMSLNWGPLGGPEPSFHTRAPRWHGGRLKRILARLPVSAQSPCSVSLSEAGTPAIAKQNITTRAQFSEVTLAPSVHPSSHPFSLAQGKLQAKQERPPADVPPGHL